MKYQSQHWRDWINERFGDKDKYFIDVDDEKIEYVIRSTDKTIKTHIIFCFMGEDDNDVLYDIYFRGEEKSFIWSSPFPKDPKYKPKLIQQIKSFGRVCTSLYYRPEFIERLENEWLYIPLQKGWTEELQYLDNQICRAKLKIGTNQEQALDINNPSYVHQLKHYQKLQGRLQAKWDIEKDFFSSDWQHIKFEMNLGADVEQKVYKPLDRLDRY